MRFSPRFLSAVGIALTLFLSVGTEGRAELRYAPETKATHAYSVEIVAELPDATETMKGVIVYHVKESKGDQIKLDYRGGLSRSRKAKAAAGARRPGPRGFGGGRRPGRPAPGPHNPFAAPTFKGLTQSTNQLTLSPEGDVLAIEGSSQLPYLLGNLSTLIFEPFPGKQQNAWEVKNGITITETNERQSFPRFGPRRPGSDSANEGKRSAGVETSQYKIAKTENDSVTIDKTYHLESPVVDGKGFEFTGQGTWVFDQAESFPQKLDFRQTLTVNVNNVSLKVPMTCQYERLTEKQLAAHQETQKKRQEEAKARLAKVQEQGKARRNAPLTAEQKADVLEKLASDRFGEVLRGLNTLRFKNPKEPDPEIAAALKKLADHKNPAVRRNAEQVAKKWTAVQSEK